MAHRGKTGLAMARHEVSSDQVGSLPDPRFWTAIEDDSIFSEISCPSTGVLAWPAIRQDVIRALIGDRYYAGSWLARPGPGRIRRVLASGLRAALTNARSGRKRSDVVLVTSGAGLIDRGGRMFNRYADHFVAQLGLASWTLEALAEDRWPTLPRSNDRLSFEADHRLWLLLAGSLGSRPRHRAMATELVDRAAALGRDRLGWDLGESRRNTFIALGARRLAAYPARARHAEGVIRSVRPRLAIVEEGCYGHMAVFNSVARASGVRVAEFQHGMVTSAHDAYSVAPRLEASDSYRSTLPDVFLSYGDWWNQQFGLAAVERKTIGNPHRTEALGDWAPVPDRHTVVVLGDGVDTETTLAFAARLAEALPTGLRVAFRPHPLERSYLSRQAAVPVDLDLAGDLYESLSGAVAVVGEASTALFEAVGLVDRIFAWDTPKSRFYLGNHPFEVVWEPEQIAEAMRLASRSSSELHVDDVWAPDWRARFARFVDGPQGS